MTHACVPGLIDSQVATVHPHRAEHSRPAVVLTIADINRGEARAVPLSVQEATTLAQAILGAAAAVHADEETWQEIRAADAEEERRGW